jgi:uncharacterized surface protein with fasciclin (FAS1) repeats
MKKMRRTTLAAVVAVTALTLAACGDSSDDTTTETAETTSEEMAVEETGAGTIVDVASNTEGFSTLVAAVGAADLVDTLNSEGPFTVFAPTDDAFAALPPGVLDALLLPENKDTLTKILTYHVVPGAVMAADVTDGDVATVEGQTVTLSTADGVTVNGATVIQADVVADNGVIHVIDAVILPPDVDPAALIAE